MIKRILAVLALIAIGLLLALTTGPTVAVAAVLPVIVVACRGGPGLVSVVTMINTELTSRSFMNRLHRFAAAAAMTIANFYGRTQREVVGLFAPPKPNLVAVCFR